MITGGLEAVLVGNPVDGQDDAIGSGEGVRSAGNGADIFGLRSNLFLVATLLHLGAILTLETVMSRWIRYTDDVQYDSLVVISLPVGVTAIGVVLAGRADDGDGLHFVQLCGSGVAGDQETTENSEDKLDRKRGYRN